MNRLSRLALVLAVLATATFVSASGAFTAAEVDRPISISTVDNGDGLVGLSAEPVEVESGASSGLFVVENRFTDDLDVSVTDVDSGDDDLTVTVEAEPADLSIGDSATVSGTVTCSESVDRDVTFSVFASGDAGTFDGTITVPVTCSPADDDRTIENVTFRGAGNVHVETSSPEELTVVYWTTDRGDTSGAEYERNEISNFDPATSLQPTIGGDTGIVAVYFPAFGVSYHHPEFDYENSSGPASWAGGPGVVVDGEIDLAS